MRVHVPIPSFSTEITTKTRFAKVLAEFSKEAGMEVRIDSVRVEAVGHEWEFRTEDEFDKASRLPEVMDGLVIHFSSKNREITGMVWFGSVGRGMLDGP